MIRLDSLRSSEFANDFRLRVVSKVEEALSPSLAFVSSEESALKSPSIDGVAGLLEDFRDSLSPPLLSLALEDVAPSAVEFRDSVDKALVLCKYK